ncbi:leucine-rich repeat neuronal protein 4 isoform X2 [Carettochelys insculpta]|uniref:leucine-rich repeat neuronal protein 4 isoform X2 n=1 Tax=Carettochelys insculpta TaxID=44489 RepID=UPI003EC07AC2
MFSLLVSFSLLVWEAADGLTDRAAPAVLGNVTTLFHLAQQDHWESNVNLTSMSCEELRKKTWTNLRLKNNSLQAWPACLPGGLEVLDLSTNFLPALSGGEIANLPKLHALSLKNNRIQEVAWGTEALSNLQLLDLSANKLSSVPSCHSAYLPKLKWLSLAGNPVTQLQPLSFSCYPQLQFLNLSTTLLGQEHSGGISTMAFAMNVLPGDTTDRARSAIHVLDLSETFLENIQQEWAQHLASLRSLHLARMPWLKSLDPDLFKSLPWLRELNCQDSHALSGVRTELFNDTHHLNFLAFQKASDTTCYTASEDREMPSSSSLSLLQLYNKCQADRNTTFPISNTQPLTTEESSVLPTDKPTTVAAVMDSTPFTKELYRSSLMPQNLSVPQTAQTMNSPISVDISPNSTNHPSTEGAAAPSSTILGELYSDFLTQQSTVSITKTDPWKSNATATNAVSHQEETFHQSTNNSIQVTGLTGTQSLLSPGTISPSQIDQLLQNPTRTNPVPNPSHAVISGHYVDDYDDDQPKEAATQQVVFCGYDPCQHLQKPCSELQRLSQCLCPGVSGDNTIPDPPRLKEVSETTDTSAQIHWCAPNSVVNTYQLVYHAKGSEKSQLLVAEIYPTARKHTLYKLSPDTTYRVCVMASNKAGSSQTTKETISGNPCTHFTTKPSYKSIFAALSLTTGVFLITTIVLSVCLYQKCKKPQAERYSTHLVSYKNPAFD